MSEQGRASEQEEEKGEIIYMIGSTVQSIFLYLFVHTAKTAIVSTST